MNGDLQDTRAIQVHTMMMESFGESDLRSLYFQLSVDIDAVPKPANKHDYIEYLMRHMFFHRRQQALTTLLKNLRPHLDWPVTYFLPVAIPEREAAKPQRRKSRPQNNHVPSKDEKLQKISEDLYRSVFKLTPIAMWLVLFLILFMGIALPVLHFTQQGFGIEFDLIVIVLMGMFLLILYSISFSWLKNYLRSSTPFYSLPVTDRMRVRRLLQGRPWGNKVTNFFCRILIRLYLVPNLHDANKRI